MRIKYKYCYVILIQFFTAFAFSQGIEIKSGGNIKATGAASIRIYNGNFVNNGTYSNGTEIFTMSGNAAKTMSGKGATNIYQLNVTNSGGITTRMSQIGATTLNIAAGSRFVVDTTSAVNVSNTVTNNVGVNGLVLKANANAPNGSLIFHNDYTSPVSATVEMYSKAFAGTYSGGKYSNYKWQFIGVPLRTVDIASTFYGAYIRKFNEAGSYVGNTSAYHWINMTSGNMTSFNSYEITQPAAKIYNFAGQLENRDYSSGKLAITTNAQYPGQHLIGNSYTAAIDISKIEFGTPNEKVIENTIYIYNSGSYSDWFSTGQGSTGIYYDTPGQYYAVPKNVAGQYGILGQIPSMQAFLVVVQSNNDSAWIKIPYSSTGTVVKNNTMQRSNVAESVCTVVDLKSAQYNDRTWIFTKENCTSAFDNGYDGRRFESSAVRPQIYTIEESGLYQINCKNDIDNTQIVFVPGTEIEYKLVFNQNNTQNLYPHMYLLDMETGITTDITANNSEYSFTATNAGVATTRFKIVTSLGVATALQNAENNQLKIYNIDNKLNMQNNSTETAKTIIYDVYGRRIEEFSVEAKTSVCRALNLPAGTYVAYMSQCNEHRFCKFFLK